MHYISWQLLKLVYSNLKIILQKLHYISWNMIKQKTLDLEYNFLYDKSLKNPNVSLILFNQFILLFNSEAKRKF